MAVIVANPACGITAKELSTRSRIAEFLRAPEAQLVGGSISREPEVSFPDGGFTQ
jgi:hypothetical protein